MSVMKAVPCFERRAETTPIGITGNGHILVTGL
jgi:hypothetical protein